MWHAFIIGNLTIGDLEITAGSYQAPSLARNRRADEAERLMLAAGSGWTKDLLIFGCDNNSLSNARTAAGDFYDVDPYQDAIPHPQHVFQIEHVDQPDGTRAVRADRRPAETLSYGGLLRDAAATLGGDWQYTIGHQRDLTARTVYAVSTCTGSPPACSSSAPFSSTSRNL